MTQVLSFDEAVLDRLGVMLADLEHLHRRPTLKKALGGAADKVVGRYRQLLPQPGMPGYVGGDHDPRLFETVGKKVKEYDKATVVLVGVDKRRLAPTATKRPTNLEHLVEKGFVIGGSAKTQARKGHKKRVSASAGKVVPGKHALENAISQTEAEVTSTMIATVEAEVQKIMDQ